MARRAGQLIVLPALDFELDGLAPPLQAGAGGVLFLGRAQAPSDLADRIDRASAAPGPGIAPAFLADQEGGGVQRIKGAVDPIPWARTMGATMTPAEIEALATRTATQLHDLGIGIDLAPVLDIDDRPGPSSTNPDGERAFGGTVDEVIGSGLAFQRGLTAGGVLPVVKHFPGLGHSTANTDHAAAATQPIGVLRATDLVPFRAAIDAGAPAVMVANASVPGLTDRPATLSPEVIEGLLRTELGFDGLVVTDSLSAEAIFADGRTLPDAAVQAVTAGADLVLFGSTIDARETALLAPAAVATTYQQIVDALVGAVGSGQLAEERLDAAVAHVLTAKGVDLCGG
ncbi:MAG: hypothetical protein JWO77_2207 [Ilumatobacteraceae bacterium]|nr:hypothetical protein [Ilumatobacteraceae bacterium]